MSDGKVSPPSRKPADDDTLGGALRTVLRNFLMSVDDCLPAKVIAFDRAKNRVTVQPLVQMVTTSGERVSRAQIASVPVFQIGGGGFTLNFPIKSGDIGYIKACDRDVSLFLQTMGEAQPNTKRLHSFSDGVFFPAALAGFTIDAEDADHPVLQSLDGSVRIALWPTCAKVTAANGLVISDRDGEGNAGCLLDVRSILKASRPWPSMTASQRNAIPSPESGMAVWLMPDERLSTYAHGAWS